jgi:hypothetical protein
MMAAAVIAALKRTPPADPLRVSRNAFDAEARDVRLSIADQSAPQSKCPCGHFCFSIKAEVADAVAPMASQYPFPRRVEDCAGIFVFPSLLIRSALPRRVDCRNAHSGIFVFPSRS